MSTRLGRVLVAALASTWLLGCGPAEPSARERPRNLLLISLDSVRADHLGAYGYEARFRPDRPVSPQLDRLATQGIRFDSCWSSTSWTLPSHVALFTGLDDPTHGVVDDRFRVDPAHQTLAEHLSASGYRCRGIFSGPYLEGRFGFDRGFESWRSARISETELVAELEAWKQRRVEGGAPEPTIEEIEALRRQAANWDVTGHRINDQALQELEDLAATDRPWFLFVHYYDPHYDYLPGEADPVLADWFDPDYRGLYSGVRWYFDPAVRDFTPPYTRRIPERDLQHVEALYDGEIHFVDRQVGSLLTRLERLGLAEDTVVAVVSDHGDEFFDRGGIGHRSHLHTELTRAVFLLRGAPGTLPGSVVEEAVGFVDVAPTLIEALGAPAWAQPLGKSALTITADRDRAAFSHLFTDVPPFGPRHFESWRNERFTVIRPFAERRNEEAGFREMQAVRFPDGSPAYLVFDRQGDPEELRPIPPSSPAFRMAVEAMREDFLARRSQQARVARSPLSDRLADRAAAQEQAMLEELGYVGDREQELLPLAPLPVPELPPQ